MHQPRHVPDPADTERGARASISPGTILFTPMSSSLFHVGRCVMVARELEHRGHRIVMAGLPRYLQDPEVVATARFEFHALPDFSVEDDMAVLRSIRRAPDRRLLDAMIEAEIELLRRLQPDLVVTDFRATARVSTRVCGVPMASLLLGHWLSEYARRPDWVPRTYPIVARLGRVLGERLSRRLAPALFRGVIRHKTRPFRAAARAHGQQAPALIWEQVEGDLNLVSDVGSLSPRPLRSGFHRVGPLLWEPAGDLPEWVHRLDRSLPVVFVNFGSTADPALFARAFEELADPRYQVILATCGQIDARSFTVPANFHVEKYLPVAKVMESSDLVIYHGGSGTFQQALRAGLPGIVIATHWDQEFAGFVSEERGLGRFLTLHELMETPGRLAEETDRVLRELPGYRARAKELREEILRYDGPRAAADRLEDFLAHRAGGTRPGATSGAAANAPEPGA